MRWWGLHNVSNDGIKVVVANRHNCTPVYGTLDQGTPVWRYLLEGKKKKKKGSIKKKKKKKTDQDKN